MGIFITFNVFTAKFLKILVSFNNFLPANLKEYNFNINEY